MPITINTNLSSMLVQMNLQQSTFDLNKAIERMTTGYKINHASDNAANYSIAQKMVSQLSSYDVASDNISAGMDLVKTAQDTITLLQQHGDRIHNLITQAQNGTYGEQSLQAINSEVQARIDEINRIYASTEYNGINILEGIQLPDWAQTVKSTAGIAEGEVVGLSEEAGTTVNVKPKSNGFIADITTVTPDVTVSDPLSLANAIANNNIIGISNAETLAKLAELVNGGTTCEGKTIVLTNDIDLSAYNTDGGWTPIGTEDDMFNGTFDGQGHVIKNLYINREAGHQGFFGDLGEDSVVKNLGIVNANVIGKADTGILAGCSYAGEITNCYTTGAVNGKGNTGGLVGEAYSNVSNSYSTASVQGTTKIGGLVGYIDGDEAWDEVEDVATIHITNSYATGSVEGTSNVGGLVGNMIAIDVSNSYATGNVTGIRDYIGGLVGYATGAVSNSYATGTVTGNRDYTGGLVGYATGAVSNSYATGTVTGNRDYTGGLIGYASAAVSNSYATGSVTGEGENTGGLIGYAKNAVSNSYAKGNVNGKGQNIGGLIGYADKAVSNSYATGNVTGEGENTGGLVGKAASSVSNTYAIGNVTASGDNVGGLIGDSRGISNSYATGNVTNAGGANTGGLAGNGSSQIKNSYATGNVFGKDVCGGLAGFTDARIENCFSKGNVTGENVVGGFAGCYYNPVEYKIENVASFSKVSGDQYLGSFVGAISDYMINNNYGTKFLLNNCNSLSQNIDTIALNCGAIPIMQGNYVSNTDTTRLEEYKAEVTEFTKPSTTLQVGINGNDSSSITFESSIDYDLSALTTRGAQDSGAFDVINKFLSDLSERATQLGAVYNRLESALESTTVSMENLTSSLSTIRDADVATESSKYIRAQILQQASATLLATANQSPSIALQLL